MKKILPLFLLSLLPSLSFASDSNNHSHAHSHGHEKTANVGVPGDSADVSRTIKVLMSDNMRFSPSKINVKAGETIRFSIKNTGQLQHEFVIGNSDELKEHAQMMLKMPDMQHQEPNMLSLEGGETGELIWTFNQTASIDFACLIPGHWEAGMKGKINVE